MEHIPSMAHATYSELLPSIIGLGAPGLLPGGPEPEAHATCIALQNFPTTRSQKKNLAGFRGKGVDVVIVLDAESMHLNNDHIYRSAAGVLPVPRDIPVEYIKWFSSCRKG